ncbi:MAG: hypothetical protein IJV05_03940 [Muribaculaceae bacterium]|nr:hypothetical protein [Muribaculaceae bacterium]
MKKFFTLFAVAAMAFAAQAGELTVCEGLYYSNTNPICGLYADTQGAMTQSIYPADMLAEMAGNKITSVKFYTLEHYYEVNGQQSYDETDYINFEGATFQLSLLEVDQAGYTEVVAVTGATAVATCVPEYGDVEVEFILDEPFEYNGKNLLVQVECIETSGDWGQTYFFGDGFDESYVSYYMIPGAAEDGGDAMDISGYIPMATFMYEAGDPTAVSEINSDKAVAGVRYYNMAGQEMQQANGLTIVVTTYTDGTTSAVKVMK